MIYLRHLFRSKAVTNLTYISKKNYLFPLHIHNVFCVTISCENHDGTNPFSWCLAAMVKVSLYFRRLGKYVSRGGGLLLGVTITRLFSLPISLKCVCLSLCLSPLSKLSLTLSFFFLVCLSFVPSRRSNFSILQNKL